MKNIFKSFIAACTVATAVRCMHRFPILSADHLELNVLHHPIYSYCGRGEIDKFRLLTRPLYRNR
jgi:hypothetical protein